MSICVNKPGSFECRCKEGFEKDALGKTCRDVNECELLRTDVDRIRFGCPLGSICENLFGGFKCFCKPGYKNISNKCEG